MAHHLMLEAVLNMHCIIEEGTLLVSSRAGLVSPAPLDTAVLCLTGKASACSGSAWHGASQAGPLEFAESWPDFQHNLAGRVAMGISAVRELTPCLPSISAIVKRVCLHLSGLWLLRTAISLHT